MLKVRSMYAGVFVLVLLLAACGSSKSSKSGAGDTTTSGAQQTTPTLPATTTTTSPPSPQQGTITPATDLHDGDTVTVKVTGFLPVPKNPVGINECAEQGNNGVDTPDCAIDHIAIVTIGADGTGTAQFKVLAKDVGSAKHVCGGDTRCFLSVGELSADPNVERTDDVNLVFAS